MDGILGAGRAERRHRVFAARPAGRPSGAAGHGVLASPLRRDREVRCDAGAAPATVSGEIATRSHWRVRPRREGAAIDDPEPGDLLVAPCLPTILGRRSVLPDRVEPPQGSPSDGVLPPLTLVLDGEMAERIRRHRARRGARWTTREEPLDLAAALLDEARPERPVLVDCLTLWLANLLLAGRDVDDAIAALLAALPLLGGKVVFVANEVGLGIVPDNALARAFRDHAGRLNQAVAARAQRVVFLAAGLPLTLKDVA